MLRLRVHGGEEQQLLIGELHHLSQLVPGPEGEVHAALPLPDLHIRDAGAEQGGDAPGPRLRHDLAHRPSADQHGVQIALQKGVDAVLPPARGHRPQKFPQPPLRLRVLTADRHAPGEAYDLVDGGVQHRHRLPHRPVKLRLPIPQRHVVRQHAEGRLPGAPQLHRRRGALWLPLPPKSHSVPPFLTPAAPHRSRRSAASPPEGPWRSTAGHPWRGRSPSGAPPCRSPSSKGPSPAGSPRRARRG